MLTIYRGNRAEVLAQLLAAQLRHPPPGPLEPVQVMVNTWPTSRWLGDVLALHLGGIVAHLRFPFPGSHLRRVVQLVLADGQAPATEEEPDPWRASHLVWPVLEDLPAIAAEPEGELLRLWLQGRPAEGAVDAPLWQLARAIADAFDDYALYRPELLGAWEAGRDREASGQPLAAAQHWQPRLYRRLRRRLRVAPFGLRVEEVIRRLRAGEVRPELLRRHLGERVRLFGPSSMAPVQVRLLQALAAWLPVDLYLLTPCPGLWHRCVRRRQALSEAIAPRQPLEGEWLRQAPPLEARFGRLGAEFQQLLEGTGEAQLSEERVESLFVRPTRAGPLPPRLLWQLQEHLLDPDAQPTFQRLKGDHSLDFHACPGPLRQVRIVRDRLLQLLAADPTLEPRHILVMTPAIDTFAPLVATVFGDRDATGVDLPWRLTDRSQDQDGDLGRTLLELLALAGDRLTATGLERLLESAPLRRRFGLTAEEAGGVTGLLQRCGFRWGLGAADRRGDPTHSLGWAMDRLLLGLVLPEGEGGWEGETAPARPPVDLEEGGRILHLLLRLRHWLETLARPSPCLGWVERLGEVLDDLFGADPRQDAALAPLRAALEEWRGVAGGCALPLEPAVVAAVLEERLTMDSGRFGHRSGALTISALEPMRAIPHRVVVLMGLDAGLFPRQRQRPGFHLMESGRQLGDPDPADQDRYALLEALLSARDHLVITWDGLDERTGASRPPAAPVQQWLQWLRGELPAEQAEGLVAWHEPNPLAPANFLPRGDRPPASCDRRLLNACLHLEAGIAPPDQGLAAPPPIAAAGPAARGGHDDRPSAADQGQAPDHDPGPRPLDPFQDLRAWLLAPQRQWLRELGLFPREARDAVDDLEALELDERERSALMREALARDLGLPGAPPSSAEDGGAWLRHHRGQGRFPPAQGAQLEASRLQERWHSLQATLGLLGDAHTLTPEWNGWTGSLSLRGDAVVLLHPALPKVEQRLDLWLRLQLAVAALEEAPPRRGLVVARGTGEDRDTFAIQFTFTAPDPAGAREELARLWRLRQAWRSACWPVPPDTGWTWMAQGGPAIGAPGFEKVEDVWQGNAFQGRAEREREEMGLCFGHQRSLASLLVDLPFEACARELYGPLLAAIPAAATERRR
ncbi:MAG: exodeoxyribonuclease V subunit gamma [Cyanobacteriota bacterium]|nr:exodeoxyribonuclease V subunit gamma [Cyanobacteriota bacterium]